MKEVAALQERIVLQQGQLEELQRELQQGVEEREKLQQALNLENFKFELLVDLVSLWKSWFAIGHYKLPLFVINKPRPLIVFNIPYSVGYAYTRQRGVE